ncbi:hypothetical protein BDW68DRAFT_190926 [Aspergillus falconensis]
MSQGFWRTRRKGDKILRDFAAQQAQILIKIVPDTVVFKPYHTAPAIEGALNLPKAVKDNAWSTQMVTGTASCASVIDYDNLVSHPARLYAEANWNPLFAGREAWKFMNEEQPIQDLDESSSRLWRLCFNSTKDAHVPLRVMTVSEAGNERFIVRARQFDFQDVCYILRYQFAELSDRPPLGKPGTRSLPAGASSIDNSKGKQVIGLKFRSPEELF